MNQIFASLLALFAVSTLTICAPSGPTLNDLQAITCPSAKPFLCLPYGACCSGSQFCHSGLCESCFPMDIAESALLEWCREKGQYDVTLMKHKGCRLACQDVFNSSQLAHNESWAVNILENSSPPTISKLHDVMKDKETHVNTSSIVIIGACLFLSMVINIALGWRVWNSLKLKEKKTTVNSKNSIESGGIDSKTPLAGHSDPNLDEEGKSLLHEGSDNQKNEELEIHVEKDDIDLANKRESKRDSTAAQLNLTCPQVRGAQSVSAINETQDRTNKLMNRENSKMSPNDVIIHNEQDKAQDIANVHQSQHSPRSCERQKPFLPQKKNTHELSNDLLNEDDFRSPRGDESHEHSGREETNF